MAQNAVTYVDDSNLPTAKEGRMNKTMGKGKIRGGKEAGWIIEPHLKA